MLCQSGLTHHHEQFIFIVPASFGWRSSVSALLAPASPGGHVGVTRSALMFRCGRVMSWGEIHTDESVYCGSKWQSGSDASNHWNAIMELRKLSGQEWKWQRLVCSPNVHLVCSYIQRPPIRLIWAIFLTNNSQLNPHKTYFECVIHV